MSDDYIEKILIQIDEPLNKAETEMLVALVRHACAQGGELTVKMKARPVTDDVTPVVFDPRNDFIAGYHFGREAEDSDMAGGAAYGMGLNVRSVLRSLMQETGIRP